jgi:hypothetical protein
VDPVPDPLVLRKSGSAGIPTRTSGSVARRRSRPTTLHAIWPLLGAAARNAHSWLVFCVLGKGWGLAADGGKVAAAGPWTE